MLVHNGKFTLKEILCSTQIASNYFSQSVSSYEWNRAIPLSEMPGPSRLRLLYDVIPSGRNMRLDELVAKNHRTYGDIFRWPRVFGQPDTVIIFDPDQFQRVYRNEGKWPIRGGLEVIHHYRYKKRPGVLKYGGLGVDDGQKWSELRAAVNPAMLQPKIVKLYVSPIDEIANEFVARMKQIRDPDTLELPADFEEEVNAWSLESISMVAFNARLGAIGNNDENSQAKKFLHAVRRLFHLLTSFVLKPPIWRIYPTADFRELMKVMDIITNTGISYVEAAEEQIKSKEAKGDLSSPGEESVLEKLVKVDPQVAIIMTIDMITAGVDTTSSAFISTLYCLSKNPAKQEILRDEILGILPSKHSKLTPDKMKHLPYLRAFIKESLRMFPVLNFIARTIDQDMVISNYQIPKGTKIIMDHLAAHNTDAIYKNFNEFIPERWLKASEPRACPEMKGTKAFACMPFGFGPRMCVGRRFGELEIEATIARIVRNFRVEWHKPDLKFQLGFINTPAHPLQFKLIDINE